jgi:hypothetical protein
VVLANTYQEVSAFQRFPDEINSRFLGSLGRGFEKVLQKKATLEEVRDIIRQKLHTMNAEKYPLGKTGASVGYLAVDMLKSNRVVTLSQIMCSECDYAEPELADQLGYTLCTNTSFKSTLDWVSKTEISINTECPNCSSALTNPIFYKEVPQILICEYPLQNIKTSHKITFVTGEKETVLHLRGIVYHGGFHFTSRIISADGDIWFNDGMTTARTSEDDGHLKHTSDSRLKTCRGNNLVLAVYAQ